MRRFVLNTRMGGTDLRIGGAPHRRQFAEPSRRRRSREPIAAIALTGQMHGAVMLDETAHTAAGAHLVRHAHPAGVRLVTAKIATSA